MEFFIFFSLIVVLLLLRIVVFNKRSEVNIIKFEEKIKIIKSLYGILNSTKPDFKYLDYVSFIYQHSHGTIYYEYVVKNLNKFVYYFINMVHTFLILLFLFFLLISFLFIEFVMFFFIFFYKIFSNSIKIKFDFNKLNEIFLKKPLQFLGSILVFPLFLLVEFSFYLFDILDLIVFVFSHIYVILYNRFIVPTLLLISFIKFGGSLFYNFYSFLFLSLRSFLSLRIRRSHYGRKFTRRLLGPSLKVKDNLIYFFFYKSRTSINDPLVYNKFFFFIRGLLFTITYFIFVLFFIFFSQFAYLNSGFINGIINTNFTFIFRFSEAGIYFFLYSIVIYIWYIGSSSEEEVIKYNDYNYILNDIYDKKKNFFGNITTSVGEDGYSENEIESKYEQLLGLSLFFWMMVFSNMYLMDSGDLHKVTPGFLDGLFQFNMENDQFWFKDLFAKIFGKIPYKVSEKKKLFILRPLDYEYLLMYSEQWLGYLQFHKIVYHYDKYPRMMHEEIGQNYPPTFTLAYKLYAKVQYVNHILYEKWRSNVSNIIYYDSEIFKDWKRGKAPKYFLRNSGLVFDYAGKMPARLMDNEIYIVDVYPTDSIRNNLQRACYKWIYSNHNIDLDSKYARYLRLYNYKIHWVKDIRHIPVKGAYVIGSNEDVFSAVIAEREFSQRERALVIFPRFLKKSAQETILRLYRTIWFWQPMFDHIGYFIKRKFPGQFSYLLSVFYHILGNPEQSEFYLTRSKYEYKGEMESRLASIENFLYFQDKNFTELFLNIICSRQFVFETLKAVRFNNVMRTFPDYLTTYVPPGLIGNYSNSASRYLLMIDRLNLELLHGCRGKDLSEFAHIPSYFDIRKDHDLFLELANRLGRHCSVDEFRIAKSLGYATIRGSFGLCNVSPRAAWRTLEVFYGLIYTKHYQIIEKYAIDQLMDAVAHIGLEDTEEAKRLRYAVYVLYRVDYRPLSGEYDYWKLYHIWDTEDTEYRDYEWHYDEWSYGAEPDELRIILLDWYGPIDLDLYLD